MGYDFSFVRLAPKPERLPFHPDRDFDGRLELLSNPSALEQYLLTGAGFRRNGQPYNGRQRYWWDTPDGGSLNVSIDEDSVNVDTHSHWQYVLKLYEQLCALESELLILDRQTAIFYDADTYRQFVQKSYAKKT
jgi:hypothetical protein